MIGLALALVAPPLGPPGSRVSCLGPEQEAIIARWQEFTRRKPAFHTEFGEMLERGRRHTAAMQRLSDELVTIRSLPPDQWKKAHQRIKEEVEAIGVEIAEEMRALGVIREDVDNWRRRWAISRVQCLPPLH